MQGSVMMMTVNQSKARDFAYYNQMRRCTPDRFYKPILQKQMREDCLVSGHELFFETEWTPST
jgi:hypothetical protein